MTPQPPAAPPDATAVEAALGRIREERAGIQRAIGGRAVIAVAAVFGMVGVVGLTAVAGDVLPGAAWWAIALLAVASGAVLSGASVVERDEAAKNRATDVLVEALVCVPLAMTYTPEAEKGPYDFEFERAGLIPVADVKSITDIFRGVRDGRPFTLYQARLTSQFPQTREWMMLLAVLPLPRRFEGTTTILRRDDSFFHQRTDLDVITLEDSVFNGAFAVRGSDPVSSRALLTPTFMEHLLALNWNFRSSAFRCMFQDRQLFLSLQCSQLVVDRHVLADATLAEAREVLKGLAGDIRQVLAFVDLFIEEGGR